MTLVDHLRACSGRVGTSLARVPREPARRWAILSCLDARLQLETICDLRPGDAHILRNAGAVVTDDVIRSLVISAHLLGSDEFAVIAHTNCGMLGLDEGAARRLIASRSSADATGLRLLGFSESDAHVREQVTRIASSGLLPGDRPVSGWIFDVADGSLREIVVARTAA